MIYCYLFTISEILKLGTETRHKALELEKKPRIWSQTACVAGIRLEKLK